MHNSSGIELTATHVQFDSVAQGRACHDDPAQPAAMLKLHGEWRCMLGPSARSAHEPNGSAAIRFTVNCICTTDVRMHHSWQLTPRSRGGKLSRRAAIRLPNLQTWHRINFGHEKIENSKSEFMKNKLCASSTILFSQNGVDPHENEAKPERTQAVNPQKEKSVTKTSTHPQKHERGMQGTRGGEGKGKRSEGNPQPPLDLQNNCLLFILPLLKKRKGCSFAPSFVQCKRKVGTNLSALSCRQRNDDRKTSGKVGKWHWDAVGIGAAAIHDPPVTTWVRTICIGSMPCTVHLQKVHFTFVSSGAAQFDISNTLHVVLQFSCRLTVAHLMHQL
eukprot:jgi/Bigna1/70878/fgenesh1_pg.13_\